MFGRPPRWLTAIAATGLLAAGLSTAAVTQAHASAPVTQTGPAEVGNLLNYANTDFEGTLGNWVSNSNAKLTDDTAHSFLHNDSLLDTATAAGSSSFSISGTPNAIMISLPPGGTQFRVGAYFKAPAASGQTVRFSLGCWNSSGQYIGDAQGQINALQNTTKWQYSEDDITVLSGCTYVQGSPKVTLGGLKAGATVNMDEVIFAPERAALIIGAHGQDGEDQGTAYSAQDWLDTNWKPGSNETQYNIGPLQSDKQFYNGNVTLPGAWNTPGNDDGNPPGNNCYGIEQAIDNTPGGSSAEWPACVINFQAPYTQAQFAAFFTNLPPQQMVIMLYHGEAEGSPSFSSAAQFQSDFEAESQAIRKAAVTSTGQALPNVFVAQGSTTYQYSASTTGTDNAGMVANGVAAPCQYIVPNRYADFYIADHYDNGVATPSGKSLPDEPFVPQGATASGGQKWRNWLGCVQPMNKPIGLGEYGLDCHGPSGGPDQSQVTDEMGDDNNYLGQILGVMQPTILWEYWYSSNSSPGCVFDNSAGGKTKWQSIETQNGGG